MRRRLDLAASLVTRPPVLFLDEPTTGLDPTSRVRMWDVIRELVADGTTLLLTTQYLDEADELADRIVVIDHGRVIATRHRRRAEGADRRRPARGHPDASPTAAAAAALAPLVSGRGARRATTAAACARRSAAAPGSPPTSSARSTTPASPSTTSRSTSRRSTTCSSPSPATPAEATDADRSRRADCNRSSHGCRDHPLREPRCRDPRLAVLTGRNLVHIAREPLQLSDVTVQPVLFTLLFVYVFGAGVVLPGGGSYTDFAIAGLLALNLTTSSMGTAVGLSTDLITGVIDRFRTLPMWRPAVLVGRSLADLLTAALCTAIVARDRPRDRLAARTAASCRRSAGSASSCSSATPCRGPAPASASSARAPSRPRASGS